MSEPRLRSFSTQRPVAILMLFVAAAVFGWLSLGRLAVNLMPELSYPTITVRTEYPGAAPEEVENDVSRPIEEALGVVGGLQRISSVSRAEVSDVILEFGWDAEISDVTQDVLERLDLVFLPDEAERPLILSGDQSLRSILSEKDLSILMMSTRTRDRMIGLALSGSTSSKAIRTPEPEVLFSPSMPSLSGTPRSVTSRTIL